LQKIFMMKINKNITKLLLYITGHIDVIIDVALIVLVTGLAFGMAYHPYFFGDELIAQRLAIQHNYSLYSILQGMNVYKPRLVFNGMQALLTGWHASRLVYATLAAGFMIWINVLLYGVTRYLFKGGRTMAWLVVAVVLTSRYGITCYFNYSDGLGELLSAALFLSVLLLAWLAWRERFKWSYAIGALFAAVLCIFTLERYEAGLMAVGLIIAIAEYVGISARRRILVICWSLSLGVVPLLLFLSANMLLGSSPIMTGTAGQQVVLGWGTIWSALTYCYDVFLGGNYGHEWFWGSLNYLNPIGKIIGWITVLCTATIIVFVILQKKILWINRWLGISFTTIAVALIAVASLTGLERQESRYMIPVGILVAMIWIVMVKGVWRYVAIILILITNSIYLISGSYDSMASVYSSRAADSVASSLLDVKPNGTNGIVVGNSDDSWSIGGGAAVDMGPRQGDTFSEINLKSTVHIDPFVEGRTFDPTLYDFGMVFTGFGPHRTARYRVVSANEALILAGISSVDGLPIKTVLGDSDTWSLWQWNIPSDQIKTIISLKPGINGWLSVPATNLDNHLLVYTARATSINQVPMRLQVNWHTIKDNRFISTTIKIVEVSQTWQSYAAFFNAPPGAEIGYVYATLSDGANGEVQLKSVDIR
jgi:hypothetical protein